MTRVRRLARRAMAIAGVALTLYGARGLATQWQAIRSYDELARETATTTQSPEGSEPNVDWDHLLAMNPYVVAWCRVEGTAIDLPVCQATDDDPGHWLGHDLWDNDSPAGVPYIDHRTDAASRHVLCYGHHLAGTGGMFSELSPCHEQEAFDSVLGGDLMWSTPDGRTARLRPLCASKVDKDDAAIQSLRFDGDAAFRAWLATTLEASSARSCDAQAIIPRATRAITLVTCSSSIAGQRERTVVTFVA